ncbi:FAD/FMN-containing dehydrogenase [Asanoa ferruginea]|uniref:FAD/FMN-containing dehydrogenase n=1 Tax=Asanoa ferruginea TaxID=53367 RepID=A0A3D9ZQY0_9ACTN|nr:FAD/FMN-containing dehydrogenase [Asanoa ferruginea]
MPGDERYAEDTATWNLAHTHRPAVVVGAACVADIQAAVRFAHAHNLATAVVATGHGAVLPADGAVLINLRRMDTVVIDADRRRATVGPAVEMQSLVDAAAAEGLAPLTGSSPNVGVVGFTLGGGLSPVLGRAHGYAADHVRSAEIVTADGELRTIDAQTEPDLFWAIRGGKGNFGVITSLTIDLFPVTRLYGGGLFYGGGHVGPVLNAYRKLAADAPDELTVSFAFLRLPPLPFVPMPLRGRFAVHVRVAYLGSATDGERLVADLRAAAPPLIDSVVEMPYSAVASIHADPVDPVPAYEVGCLLSDFPEKAADALVAAVGPGIDTPLVMIEVRQLGGALAREPRTPNAVDNRDAPFQLFAATVGAPGMEAAFWPALSQVVDTLAPWVTGRKQVNFLTAYDTTPEAVEQAYDPATYARLARIKAAYDPGNLFRINHNIPPRD